MHTYKSKIAHTIGKPSLPLVKKTKIRHMAWINLFRSESCKTPLVSITRQVLVPITTTFATRCTYLYFGHPPPRLNTHLELSTFYT